MSITLVVPCYNEAARWQADYWRAIVTPGVVDVLLVDDGSTDGTRAVVQRTVDETGARLLSLPVNAGKAEAVRQGLLEAWSTPSTLLGFLDADGAFPATEVLRMVGEAEVMLAGDDLDALWSARVLMAGRDIQRHTSRHYLGRVLTTLVAPWHGYAIYDTQAGYKIFRRSDVLHECLKDPFETRWFPDIELLQRWHRLSGRRMRIWEDPVTGWHDVAGSKMTASQYRRILADLSHLHRGRIREPQRRG
jgi:glycosyltransferase involved in cell wall biosynthesis